MMPHLLTVVLYEDCQSVVILNPVAVVWVFSYIFLFLHCMTSIAGMSATTSFCMKEPEPLPGTPCNLGSNKVYLDSFSFGKGTGCSYVKGGYLPAPQLSFPLLLLCRTSCYMTVSHMCAPASKLLPALRESSIPFSLRHVSGSHDPSLLRPSHLFLRRPCPFSSSPCKSGFVGSSFFPNRSLSCSCS